ncbi:MAG: tRNA (cytidine(34)-2'-O)-methyltransferase [Gammaproteobacteria bacterium]|nr:tRNA (cytidine(34)-2'-O)-methyltransferase [Gammaproteobacteria bacterium]
MTNPAADSLHVVLFEPEIPPNTGNVIRLCANTGAQLHLVGPLGFRLEDRLLRRAGLDYHEWVTLTVHPSLEDFTCQVAPRRLWAFTTHATRRYDEPDYQPGDALLFGPESRGLPKAWLDAHGAERCLRIPMRPGNRSLNLSNAVAIVVFEAWRQRGFAGGL